MGVSFGQARGSEPLRCACCGADIEGFPTDFAAAAPWRQCGVTEADFGDRVHLTRDICVVDDEAFFIRGNIELPIVGTEKSFAWGVWCSLSKESFGRVLDRWDEPEPDEACFGWLSSALPG